MSQPCSHSERMNGQHQQVMVFSGATTAATPKRPFCTNTMMLIKKEHHQLLGVYLLGIEAIVCW